MKKYYLKTFGCQMNESDSERIASFLEQQNYKITEKMENADLIVIVACSVRQTAIDRIFGLKKKFLKTQNSKLKTILTGCVLKTDKPKFKTFFDEVLTIGEFLGKNYLELKPKHANLKSAFVPIMTGCNNFCSYCAVPYTRGREISRPFREVIREVKDLIKKGYKEIILLGQNVNSYQYGFPKLLKELNALPGDFKIKFLTNHPKDMSDELIDAIAECKKVEKEIHLPIQSGDDEILKKMNRNYTVKQYKSLVNKIRAKIPDIRITTDVIVGFPGETKEQFQNTIKLFKEIKYNLAYVNKYSVRLGTPAAGFKDDVPLEEKKRRWKIINAIANPPTPKAASFAPLSGVAKAESAGKLIVVLGPTASGKSALAVKLAKKFNGEIVSADSRQVYKGMDIGTGKTVKKEMQGIFHHMIDVATPKKQFSVAEYRKLVLEAINKIYKKGKIPILCGGTGFYIRAVAEGLVIPEVKPDWKLRRELDKKTIEELFKQLKKLDPQRAKTIDAKNKRRLIRALEIIIKTGEPVPKIKKEPQFNITYIGIKKSPAELKKLINKRVDKMIKMGLMKEVDSLIKKYGQTIVLKNTIGYKEWLLYYGKTRQKLRILTGPPVCPDESGLAAGKLKKEIIKNIKLHTYQYAKRQMTWFKQNKKINWV